MDETLFFLHLPRTAGTTLNAVLHDNFAPETILSVYAREDYERCRMLEADALEPIRLIEGHLMPECFDPPSLYGRRLRMFTLLREPLSRLVSEYVFQKSWPGNHLYAYLNENAVSFRDYLTSNDPLLKFRGRNFVTHCLAGVFAPDRNRTRCWPWLKNIWKKVSASWAFRSVLTKASCCWPTKSACKSSSTNAGTCCAPA